MSSPAVPTSPAEASNAPRSASIREVLPERPLRDVMRGAARWEVPIHEHGLIALVDAMPRLVPQGKTGDQAIVQAARVSYGV